MFTTTARDAVLQRMIDGARADSAVTALALLGPAAAGTMDAVDEIELMVASDDPGRLGRSWTDLMYAAFGAVHHAFADAAVVYVLPDLLLVNAVLVATKDFGPRGAEPFRPVFGTVTEWAAGDPVGTAVRSAVRARAALIRGVYLVAATHLTRLHGALTGLAAQRLGVPPDRLPHEVSGGLAAVIPAASTVPAVEAAYRAAVIALDYELQAAAPELGDAVALPLLEELAAGS